MNPITLRRLRSLELKRPPSLGRPAHLAAASGLVLTGGAFHVVADDELHIGVFDAEGEAPGEMVRVFPGELPLSRKARKKAKPDGEALVRLPPLKGYRHGALLALGSGSRPTRCRGALIPLNARGSIVGPAVIVDLASFYDALDVADLNIEGAYHWKSDLFLLQRGNRGSENFRIRLPLAPLLKSLAVGRAAPVRPISTEPFDLGAVQGIPLGFTDGAALPHGRMLFTAVAEDTNDSYKDGPCAAAALGIAAPGGKIEFLGLLRPAWKVEGVAAWVEGRKIHMRLVTDADDATRPAMLLAGEVGVTW